MSIPRQTQPNRAGFTLVEVLVVLAILAVVSAVGTSAFVTITSVWNEKRSQIELDAIAEEAFDSIRTDIADALSQQLAGVPLTGVSATIEDDRTFPAATNADDRIVIPIQGYVPGRTLNIASKVGYRVDRSHPNQPLVRTQGGMDETFPTTNRLEIIELARVVAFSVEYLDAGQAALWVEEWDQKKFPGAVRVSLTLEDPDRSDFQIARKAVIPINVE